MSDEPKYLTVDLKDDGQRSKLPSYKQAMIGSVPKAPTAYTMPAARAAERGNRSYAGPTPRTPMRAVPSTPDPPAAAPPSEATVPGTPSAPVAPAAPAARRAPRPFRALRRSWRRFVTPFTFASFADLEVMLWIVGVVAAFGVVTPVLVRVVPRSIRASQATERIAKGYGELFDAEEEALLRDGNYVDPARFMRDQGIAELLDPQYEVLVSQADDNHWFLKLRSQRAGTICTALSMTYLTRRGGGFVKDCRPMDARDSIPAPAP